METQSELKKLSDENLAKQPDEVFDIICKIGRGSYGSVFKSLHKETGQVLAIKQVPVDTDLQEIIKEISIMQQCDSKYIVKYYGSYFKNTDLWIVMEYCGAGSVSDIMRLRNKTLVEREIATILYYTLKGLEYLHSRRKIHRDIKAGNILLNNEGHAKLADFGVAGQLTDTMAKRNTVIDIHPMRAIFMIPTKPPPSFRQPDKWSAEFIDFVSKCLVKSPENRATAVELLEHDFIKKAESCEILQEMIREAKEIQEMQNQVLSNGDESGDDEDKDRTMVKKTDEPDGTMKAQSEGTLVPETDGTLVVNSAASTLQSELGTMVINQDSEEEEEEEEEDDGTMKRHSTATGGKEKYRPAYLDHFEKKEQEEKARMSSKAQPLPSSPNNPPAGQQAPPPHPPQPQQQHQPPPKQVTPPHHFQRSFIDGDFEFLRTLAYEELEQRLADLDPEMEREIEELRARYQAKRQPIQDAIDAKRKRQQNF